MSSLPNALALSGLLAMSSVAAPFQCASDPDPKTAREETASEALLGLANRFEQAGDREAMVRTLRYLVERYPASHEAEEARTRLGELGGSPEPSSAEAPAASASASP